MFRGRRMMSFQEQLEQIKSRAGEDLLEVTDLQGLDFWERQILGSKGDLTALLKQLGTLSAEERPVAGRAANAVKVELTTAYESRRAVLAAEAAEQHLVEDAVDVTLPGRPQIEGVAHPVSLMIRELSDIFALMGFQTV